MSVARQTETTPPTWLEGGCHCGAVRLRVAVRRWEALDCNCSICTQKGYLHLIVPRDDVQWLAGQDSLTEYTFGTGIARHWFCPRCGVQPVYRPRSHPDQLDVNVRCLDDAEARGRFQITPFDGQRWEAGREALALEEGPGHGPLEG